MAPKSVTFRRHDHLVSVLFGDLLSHSYNITFSMFLYLVSTRFYINFNEWLERETSLECIRMYISKNLSFKLASLLISDLALGNLF